MDLPNDPRYPVRLTTSNALSEELTSLLNSCLNSDEAVAEISNSPALFREAQAALPVLREQALGRSGEEGVRQVIGRRFALFPQPQRSDGEWAMWWADYYEALASVPLCALEAAMAAYVRLHDSEFMPKPGKLLELSKTTPNRGAQAYGRALKATTGKEPERLPFIGPTEEEKAKVKAMLTSFNAKHMATVEAYKPPPMPATHGKADAGGLTPEMRALIERRGGHA